MDQGAGTGTAHVGAVAVAALELGGATAEQIRSFNALDEGAILDIVREGLRQDRVDLYLQLIVSLPQRKQLYF